MILEEITPVLFKTEQLCPQSAGINMQSLQSESTPRRLTLVHTSIFV